MKVLLVLALITFTTITLGITSFLTEWYHIKVQNTHQTKVDKYMLVYEIRTDYEVCYKPYDCEREVYEWTSDPLKDSDRREVKF